MFTISCYVLSTYYSGLDSSFIIPSWACFACASLYFIYYFLDVSDGKQARKLNKSSPLGFIMDHNLDSVSIVLITITAANIIQMKTPIEVVALYLMCTVPFYIATWEEYVTGIMELPMISGVDEGCFVTNTIFIFTGLVGANFWNNAYIFDIQLKLILLSIFIGICVVFTAISIYNVLRKPLYYTKFKAFTFLTIYIISNTSLIYVITNISPKISLYSCPKVICLLYGFIFAKLNGQMQISHLARMELDQNKVSSLTISFSLPIVVYLVNKGLLNYVVADFIFYIMLVFSVLAYIQFFVCVIKELSRILRVPILSLNEYDTKKQ